MNSSFCGKISWITKVKNYFLSMKKKELLVSCLITAVIVGFAVIVGAFTFETNDERDFSNLFSGAFGNTDTQFSGFINVIFGYLIKPLYYVNGSINWYFLVSLLLSLISLIAISYCFLKRAGIMGGTALSILLLTGMYYNFFILFQFTKNASLYSIAGLLLILETLQNKTRKFSIPQAVAGGILAVIGSLIRFKCFLIVVPVVGGYILYEIFFAQKFNIKKIVAQKKKYFITFGIVFGLVLAGYIANEIIYRANPEWKEFKEYNAVRFEVLDKGTPSYEENADKYKELGISEEDLEMFMNWSFADPEKFSKETLTEMSKMKEKTGLLSELSLSPEVIVQSVRQIFLYYSDYFLLMDIYTISLVVYLLFAKKKDWIIALLNVGLLLGYTWYLTCMDRIINRVTFGLVLSAAVFMLYHLFNTEYREFKLPWKKRTDLTNENETEETDADISPARILRQNSVWKRLLAGAVVCSVVVGFPMHIQAFEQGENAFFSNTYEELLKYTQKNSDILFVADRPSISRIVVESTMSPLFTSDENESDNITYLGGWFVGTPVNKLPLQKFGYTNAFRAMAQEENIRLIDASEENAQQKLEYLRRNYNDKLEMEIVENINELKIYRFYEKSGA